MSISELYESGNQKNNIAHFAAIANIASVDGLINDEEKIVLNAFAKKLDINEQQFSEVIKNPKKYPINPPSTKQERLEYLYDLFKMVFADHEIDDLEKKLLYKYAIGLGCNSDLANEIIKKSIRIFSGNIDFEDYERLVNG